MQAPFFYCRTCSGWFEGDIGIHASHYYMTSEQAIKLAKGQWENRLGELSAMFNTPTKMEEVVLGLREVCKKSAVDVKENFQKIVLLFEEFSAERQELISQIEKIYQESTRTSSRYKEQISKEIEMTKENIAKLSKPTPALDKKELSCLFPYTALPKFEFQEDGASYLVLELQSKMEEFAKKKRRLDLLIDFLGSFHKMQEIEIIESRSFGSSEECAAHIKELSKAEVTLLHSLKKSNSEISKWRAHLTEDIKKKMLTGWIKTHSHLVAFLLKDRFYIHNPRNDLGIDIPFTTLAGESQEPAPVNCLYCLNQKSGSIYYIFNGKLQEYNIINSQRKCLSQVSAKTSRKRIMFLNDCIYCFNSHFKEGERGASVFNLRTNRWHSLPPYPIPESLALFNVQLEHVAVLDNRLFICFFSSYQFCTFDTFDESGGWAVLSLVPSNIKLKRAGGLVQNSPNSILGLFPGEDLRIELSKKRVYLARPKYPFEGNISTVVGIEKGVLFMLSSEPESPLKACIKLEKVPAQQRLTWNINPKYYEIKDISSLIQSASAPK